MDKKPLVSIIIPNYNKEKYLSMTLESVLAQTYANWEAIVVDDGSNDNSLEVIKAFQLKDSRIKLIERKSQERGGSVCRNLGLQEAQGEYLLFVDSDDYIIETCLENRVKFLNNRTELDFAVYNIGTFYNKIGDSKMEWLVSSKDDHLSKFLMHDIPWHTSSSIWKKEAVTCLNGYLPEFQRYQDIEFHTRALLQNLNYAVVGNKKPDSFYRIDESRGTVSKAELIERIWKSSAHYIDVFKNLLEKQGLLNKVKYLNGTKIDMFRTLLYFDLEQSECFTQNFMEHLRDKALLNNLEILFLRLYRFLFFKKLYKVKGFNYVFKRTFIFL